MATPPEQLDERLLSFERSIRASNARFDREFAQCDYAEAFDHSMPINNDRS